MDTGDARQSTVSEDAAVEAAVLQHVLAVHPARLTVPELIRELAGAEVGFGARDGIERAVGELSAAGIVHVVDDFVTPTRTALRLAELLER